METLHRLKFSKNNSWAEPLAAPRSPEGSFPSSGLRGGQAPGPVDRAHPGSQPAGAGPRAPRAPGRPSGERNLSETSGLRPCRGRELLAQKRRWVVPTAVASGALDKVWAPRSSKGGSQQDHLTPT